MPRFKHIPLTLPSTEIRLLTLDLRGDVDDVRCYISTYSLDSDPVYSALSYEWGDPHVEVDISLNSQTFSARHNLWLFLHRMKKVAQQEQDCSKCSQRWTCRLWIDAVCIDQTNLVERNAQVRLMGSIYQKAHEVVAWLGWSNSLTLPKLSQHYEVAINTSIEVDFLLSKFCRCHRDTANSQEVSKAEIDRFVREICRKTYWTRRWIVQEIMLAQRVFLVFGEQELPWASVCMMFHNGLFLSEDYMESTAVQIWHHQNMRRTGKEPDTLGQLLKSYRSLQCETIHDKVYALASLATDQLFEIDYSITSAELFSRLLSMPRATNGPPFTNWRGLAANCGFVLPENIGSFVANVLDSESSVTPIGFKIVSMFEVGEVVDWSALKLILNEPLSPYGRSIVADVEKSSSDHQYAILSATLYTKFIDLEQKRAPVHVYTTTKGDHSPPEELARPIVENPSRYFDNPQVFISRKEVPRMCITWCSVQKGDRLCCINHDSCLLVRGDDANLTIVGPAWLVGGSDDLGNYLTEGLPPVPQHSMDESMRKEIWKRFSSEPIYPYRTWRATDIQVCMEFWNLMRLLGTDGEFQW